MDMDTGAGLDVGMGTQGNLGEGNEVSAEAVLKVREDMQKAAQMGAQIAGATQQNRQHAQLLIILLQHITEDKLVEHIFRQLTEYKLSIPAIFAQFLPFIYTYVELNAESGPFAALLKEAPSMSRDISGLVRRYQSVFAAFPGFWKSGDEYLQRLVVDVAHERGILDLSTFDEQRREELFASVKKELIKP